MWKLVLVSVVAAVPFALSAAPVPAPPACVDVIPHAPIVVYDLSGGTIAGIIDVSLTVYGDGWVRASSESGITGTNKAATAFVGSQAAAAFARDLVVLGAAGLCDQVSFANDLPTQTLTILRDGTDVKGRTYSWLEGNATYGPVEQRIWAFLTATFPNF